MTTVVKLSAPSELDEPQAGEGDSSEMGRVVSSDLSGQLGLGSMPVGEMVVTNGDVLADVFKRVDELEARVESLETENADLREDRDELIDAVQRIGDLLDQADSLKQVSLPENPQNK